MAPSSEYSTASGGGGRLKLKGSKVQDGRVEKKRKKKKVRKDDDGNEENKEKELDVAQKELGREGSNDRERSSRGGSESTPVVVGKTEAERRYEEARRKRVSSIPLYARTCGFR